MFVLGNFLEATAGVLGIVLQALQFLIIARAILSWVSPDPYNPIVQFIERTTEPILLPFRQLIPTYKIGVDISPILALLFLYFLKLFAVQTLLGIAFRLK